MNAFIRCTTCSAQNSATVPEFDKDSQIQKNAPEGQRSDQPKCRKNNMMRTIVKIIQIILISKIPKSILVVIFIRRVLSISDRAYEEQRQSMAQ